MANPLRGMPPPYLDLFNALSVLKKYGIDFDKKLSPQLKRFQPEPSLLGMTALELATTFPVRRRAGRPDMGDDERGRLLLEVVTAINEGHPDSEGTKILPKLVDSGHRGSDVAALRAFLEYVQEHKKKGRGWAKRNLKRAQNLLSKARKMYPNNSML